MSSKFLKVSQFFDLDIPPFVLGAFFSRSLFLDDGKYIVTTSNSKKSMKIEVPNFDFDGYIKKYVTILNEESKPYTWYERQELNGEIQQLPFGQIFFVLENDLEINADSFFNRLYAKILSSCSWIYDEELNESKKSFIRGYMELRGSIDTTANYIAQDYFYNSAFEIKKARLLVDYCSVPYYVVNINFRELQQQYYNAINQRNTQLRLHLFWYMQNIGILNEYKARIFMISRDIENFNLKGNVFYFNCYDTKHRANNILDERLNYYSTNVFGKSITSDDIFKMRSSLGFDGPVKSIRNTALVELIRYFTPDECAACKNKYNIEDRTFINKKTGRPYFEIHHVISLGDNKELDDENNMVKLCPICHKTLKKGVGTEKEQKELIIEILNNSPNVHEFAKHIFDTNNKDDIVQLIFESLK